MHQTLRIKFQTKGEWKIEGNFEYLSDDEDAVENIKNSVQLKIVLRKYQKINLSNVTITDLTSGPVIRKINLSHITINTKDLNLSEICEILENSEFKKIIITKQKPRK